ncbi:MAG: hypothetical protein IPJ74_27140 [Saprospiraceae bacterium]|nr:hypothetical protein [Saprospiraceae bacterium]
MASLTANESTGGYDAYMEVTVQGSGTTGLGHLEKEAAKYFTLGQNFPNPYYNNTAIPFTLYQASDVLIELWDLSGKKIATLLNEYRGAGEHKIDVNLNSYHLATSDYAYQMQVSNANGVYKHYKLMTAVR